MSLEVQSTSKLGSPYISMLVYGPPKTYKTRFGGTFPDPLIIAFEKGLLSLKDMNVDYVEPQTWAELLAILAEIIKSVKDGKFTYQGKEYKTLVLDPINEMYKLIMESVISMTKGREIPSMPDWGLASDRAERTIKEVVKLPCHTYFTCLEATEKDEFTGKIITGPLLPGKLMKKAPALFDYYFHSQAEPQKGGGAIHVLLTAPESIYVAGGRFKAGVLNQHEVPDFKIIYSKLTK